MLRAPHTRMNAMKSSSVSPSTIALTWSGVKLRRPDLAPHVRRLVTAFEEAAKRALLLQRARLVRR